MFQKKQLVALAVLLAFPVLGLAQTSATGSVSAHVKVNEVPITLTIDGNLEFGEFSPWGQAGSLTVSPTGSPAVTPNRVTITSQGFPARVTVSGTPNSPFSYVLPANRTIRVDSTSHTMLIEYFDTSYNATGTSPVLNSTGTATFSVGARLLVDANQPGGTYAGTFPITVAY